PAGPWVRSSGIPLSHLCVEVGLDGRTEVRYFIRVVGAERGADAAGDSLRELGAGGAGWSAVADPGRASVAPVQAHGAGGCGVVGCHAPEGTTYYRFAACSSSALSFQVGVGHTERDACLVDGAPKGLDLGVVAVSLGCGSRLAHRFDEVVGLVVGLAHVSPPPPRR